MSILGGAEPFLSGPRMPGESAYRYRVRRSLELYGMTPYQRRVELGQARGLSRAAARGHAREGEQTARGGLQPPIQPPVTGAVPTTSGWWINRAWLLEYGYTPDSTGLTWTQLHNITPRLRWMIGHSAPSQVITPSMIAEARALEIQGILAPGWAYERIRQKYVDMTRWRAGRDNTTGIQSWYEGLSVREQVPELPIEWWTYH